MSENCNGCGSCAEPQETKSTSVASIAEMLGVKQSWTKDGSAIFAFVAWAAGVSILLFGNSSSQETAIAIGGCLLPALVSALVSYKN